MPKSQTAKISAAIALSAALALQPLVTASASPVQAATGVSVIVTANDRDQTSIAKFQELKSKYELELAAYNTLEAGSPEAKRALKKATRTWTKLKSAEAKAKQQISKTFKQSVSSAKRESQLAISAATTVSAKAEAKAAKKAAIALASAARSEALEAIQLPEAPPRKK